jgi:uncharacterized protein
MNRTILVRSIDGLRSYRRLMLAGGLLALSVIAGVAASPAAAADGPTSTVSYRPLECSNAASQPELAICRDYSLGQAEARMATLFGIANSLVAMGQRADIEDSQRQWLNTRNSCGKDTACLSRSYQSRIETLSTLVGSIAVRGPF